MKASKLQELGFLVREVDGRVEAELELSVVTVTNPLTRKTVSRVLFTPVGDRLIVLDPPELSGIEPIRVLGEEKLRDLQEAVQSRFNDSVSHLERRSADLNALGFAPSVDPETLRLTAQIPAGDLLFSVAADRRGNFRVVQISKAGAPIDLPETQAFELSEFRERGALASYLTALLGESSPEAVDPSLPKENPLTPRVDPTVALEEVLTRFGKGALLPPKSPLEFLVEIRVNGAPYRFAAARVVGRTFRGLLAGAQGKLWADRFELHEFPGVGTLVAQVLKVPPASVEILPPKGSPSAS